MNPKVSVVMSVYNQEPYIRESIDSVLNQTFSDFELIIIDDGSTDGSEEIVLSYVDPRIRYVKNGKNLGIVATSNRGLSLATGKYVARLDSDDVAHEQRFERQVDFLEGRPEVGLVGSYFQTIEDNPRTMTPPVSPEDIMDFLMVGNCLGHSTIMFRRELFEQNNLLYPQVGGGAEDYAFYLQCVPFVKMANIPRILLYYRVHPKQISHVQNNLQTDFANEVRIKYVETFLKRPMSRKEIEIHNTLCSRRVLSKDELEESAAWLNVLLPVCPGKSDALPGKLREEFRKSIRLYGPQLLLTYFRWAERPKFDGKEILFILATTISWMKNRFLLAFDRNEVS